MCSNINRLVEKYLLPSKSLSLAEKKHGYYYVFRTTNGQLYLIDDESFRNKLVGPSIQKNIRPEMLIPDDTFNIKNSQFNGLLQYRYRVWGEYCIMNDEKNDRVIIRGNDIETN
jgi:hypothetical protein